MRETSRVDPEITKPLNDGAQIREALPELQCSKS